LRIGCITFSSAGDRGAPFFAARSCHDCPQLDCWYFCNSRLEAASSIGYCCVWALFAKRQQAKLLVEARGTDSVSGEGLSKVVRTHTGAKLQRVSSNMPVITFESVKPIMDDWCDSISKSVEVTRESSPAAGCVFSVSRGGVMAPGMGGVMAPAEAG
jgi:hypothetical protein